MSKELEKKSEELEQTLAKQLELLKKDSEGWIKLAAVVAVGALITYGIVKATKKNNKGVMATDRAVAVLEREGLLNDDIKERLQPSKKSSFLPSLSQRLLVLGLALAKDKISNAVFAPSDDKESEKGQ